MIHQEDITVLNICESTNSFITHDRKFDRKEETENTSLLEIEEYIENHDGLGRLQH